MRFCCFETHGGAGAKEYACVLFCPFHLMRLGSLVENEVFRSSSNEHLPESKVKQLFQTIELHY